MTYEKMLHIIIAPNSFKGSLSGKQAASCIAEGIKRSGIQALLSIFPVADGGSDTMQLWVDAFAAQTKTLQTHNPYGEHVITNYGWLPAGKTAFIGISEASGIQFKPANPDVLYANTYGTGEQISDAIANGAEKIIIGAGGSATTDGGAGLLRALGLRMVKDNGKDVIHLPKELVDIRRIDQEAFKKRMAGVEMKVLCDVQNYLLGNEGTAHIYAPQKGASEEQIFLLEQCMDAWNEITKHFTGIDMSALRFGGAAGGVAAGLHAWADAQLVNGIDYFMDAFHLNDLLKTADYLITGEGKIDMQTMKGKAPFGLAMRCKEFDVPVIAFCGEAEDTTFNCFEEVIEINKSRDIKTEMRNTASNLEEAALNWALRRLV